jgi:hypothetical protein
MGGCDPEGDFGPFGSLGGSLNRNFRLVSKGNAYLKQQNRQHDCPKQHSSSHFFTSMEIEGKGVAFHPYRFAMEKKYFSDLNTEMSILLVVRIYQLYFLSQSMTASAALRPETMAH